MFYMEYDEELHCWEILCSQGSHITYCHSDEQAEEILAELNK